MMAAEQGWTRALEGIYEATRDMTRTQRAAAVLGACEFYYDGTSPSKVPKAASLVLLGYSRPLRLARQRREENRRARGGGR